MNKLDIKTLILGAIIALVAIGIFKPEVFTGMKLVQEVPEYYYQTPEEVAEAEEELVETEIVCPTYQLSTVKLYAKDKLNPKAGIANLEVEVLAIPEEWTTAMLEEIASDPMRQVLDEDTATDSAGLAQFTAGVIEVGKEYLFSIRGDTTVYDKLVVYEMPCPSREFAITAWTISDPIYVYQVGSFSDISIDANNIITAAEDSCLNITGKSGLQYCSWDITIGQADAGKALKAPVLVLRSPEGYELEPGDIVSLYITKKTGTDFAIPATNLIDYIDVAPITLVTGLYDEDFKAYMMTAADSGTYTIKLTYDADQIQTTTDRMQFCLDDLAEYRGLDVATKSTKASAMCLEIQWGT